MAGERWSSERLDDMKSTLDALSGLPASMARMSSLVEEHTRRLDSHSAWIGDLKGELSADLVASEARLVDAVGRVDAACSSVIEEVRRTRKDREDRRLQRVIAAWAAVAVIGAALVTAGAALVVGLRDPAPPERIQATPATPRTP